MISSGDDAQALASWLEADDVALAEWLNQRCHCVSLDRPGSIGCWPATPGTGLFTT
ncbi:MAG: hypothetical protein RBS40_05200 [Rhodocyclaceae bacterium]|nr:hypothetical protein [Rhodocyclaceae bacterium]